MKEEEHLAARRKIGKVATGMLNGTINYLAGAIELESLRFEVCAYENDPDFIAFVAVLSEIDSLPMGRSRKDWSNDGLGEHQAEFQQSVEWAKEISLENCQSLAKRYSD